MKKITIKDILKRNPDEILKEIKVFDAEAFLKEKKRLEEETKKAKELANQTERERIAKMKCPFCKSKMKKHFIQSRNNGVIGRGYHSHIENEYYICLDCGIHYSDLNKPNND